MFVASRRLVSLHRLERFRSLEELGKPLNILGLLANGSRRGSPLLACQLLLLALLFFVLVFFVLLLLLALPLLLLLAILALAVFPQLLGHNALLWAVRATCAAVVALAEAYPDLGAGANFLALQEELTRTESRIALARTYYNGMVKAFNARIAVVPDSMLARLGGLKPFAFFEAKGLEREVVVVDFAS